MSIVSTITGLVKTFFFLFPFVMELFFGKAPNPYSRDPKDWREGKPAKPLVRKLAILVAIGSVVLNWYLFTLIYKLAAEKLKLEKQVATLQASTGVLPVNKPPVVLEPSKPIVPSADIITPTSVVPQVKPNAAEPSKPKPPPTRPPRRTPVSPQPAGGERNDHDELLDKLREIDRIGN